MGIIDDTAVNIVCEKCGAKDTVRAVQTGSSYGLGSWSNFSPSNGFDIESKRGVDAPNVVSAVCKKCRLPALVC